MLLLTALIWGCAFVAQSEGMQYMGPYTFQCARSILGGLVLLPVIALTDGFKKRSGAYEKPTAQTRRATLSGGVLCGILLGAASCLQQAGIVYTTPGKAGFVTALYILMVPLLGVFLKRRIPAKIWGCVAIAVAGLYLLCMNGGFYLSRGDTLVFLCAVVFAIHILAVDHAAKKVDGVRLACIQFFVAGLLSGVLMLLFETPTLGGLAVGWLPVSYAGVLSCGVAYTLQILGQKYTPPTVASLLMSLESVFAVLAGIAVLGQVPTLRESAGCILMFAAIIFAQLPTKKAKTE